MEGSSTIALHLFTFEKIVISPELNFILNSHVDSMVYWMILHLLYPNIMRGPEVED